MRKSLYDFCVENGRDSMLTQWDSGKNLPLTPQTITYGSRQKLWWRCERGARIACGSLYPDKWRRQMPGLCREFKIQISSRVL